MRVYNSGMAPFFSIVLCLLSARYSLASVKTFTADPSTIFNHLTVDRNANLLYIGAMNKIYQLSENLDVVNAVATGPVSNYDNVNKVILVDDVSNRLIICGSSGYCSARDLNNLTNVFYESQEVIVSKKADDPTVAFIAPGPTAKVMYLGVTSVPDSLYDDVIPTISSRSLEGQQLFTIPNTGEAIGPKVYVNSLSRDRFRINYVYGFSSEGFSYFLITRPKEVGSDIYDSKLVRLCQGDENYYSYTEIPISCAAEGKNFNLVQAAFKGRAGPTLAGHLGIFSQDDVLYTVFSASQPNNPSQPTDVSAICIYTLKDIRRKFTENIQNCFKGNGSRGFDFITPLAPCIPLKYYPITEDFCALDVNTPLGGELPVQASPVLVIPEKLTAIAATVTENDTVVFAGTSEGHLKKIWVKNNTSAFEYKDIVIDQGSPINKDLLFDSQQRHVYVMTESQLSKVPVSECGVHKSFSTCLQTRDPYCVWCSINKKCCIQTECQNDPENPVYY